jgi:hypothetical protein
MNIIEYFKQQKEFILLQPKGFRTRISLLFSAIFILSFLGIGSLVIPLLPNNNHKIVLPKHLTKIEQQQINQIKMLSSKLKKEIKK